MDVVTAAGVGADGVGADGVGVNGGELVDVGDGTTVGVGGAIESPAGCNGLGFVIGSFESSVSSSELPSSVVSESVPDDGKFFPEDALVPPVALGDVLAVIGTELVVGADGYGDVGEGKDVGGDTDVGVIGAFESSDSSSGLSSSAVSESVPDDSGTFFPEDELVAPVALGGVPVDVVNAAGVGADRDEGVGEGRDVGGDTGVGVSEAGAA